MGCAQKAFSIVHRYHFSFFGVFFGEYGQCYPASDGDLLCAVDTGLGIARRRSLGTFNACHGFGGGVNAFKIKALADFFDNFLATLFFTTKKEKGKTLPNFLSVFGLLLLIFGFFRIKAGMAFPGKWALVPVFGAIFLIAAGPNAFFNRLILQNKIAVFIGRISYPLYLWHWPLICYAKVYWGEMPSTATRWAILLIAILLAFLSTKFIENPLRFGNFKRFKVSLLCAAMAVLGVLGFCGMQMRLEKVREGWEVDPAKIATNIQKPGMAFYGNRQAKRKIILMGDSHIQHMTAQIVDKLGADFAIDSAALGGCLVSKTDIRQVNGTDPSSACYRARINLNDAATPDVVIAANHWRIYGELPRSKEDLHNWLMNQAGLFTPPPRKMIFLGSPGEVDYMCETGNKRKIKAARRSCPNLFTNTYLNYINWSQELMREKRFPDFVEFVYGYPDLCDRETGKCHLENEKGEFNFANNDHITYVGGEKTAQKIADIIYKEFPKE